MEMTLFEKSVEKIVNECNDLETVVFNYHNDSVGVFMYTLLQKPSPCIEKLKNFLLESNTYDYYREMYNLMLSILNISFFGIEDDYETSTAEHEMIRDSDELINFVENTVNFAVWILYTTYDKLGKIIVKKPYLEDEDLILYNVRDDFNNKRETQLYVYKLQDYLINSSNIKGRIKFANKIKNWYTEYFWRPDRVMNRDSNVNKIKNYQGYYYDIDLIDLDIFK